MEKNAGPLSSLGAERLDTESDGGCAKQAGARERLESDQAPLPRFELGFLAPEARVISTTLQGQTRCAGERI